MAGIEDVDLGSDSRLLELESAFVSAMNAADAYVDSYEALHGRLKAVSMQGMHSGNDIDTCKACMQILFCLLQAYFELARARYAMGVHSISPAQFSSQLEASKRVRVGDRGTDSLLLILVEDDDESVGLRRRSLSLSNKGSRVKEGKSSRVEGTSLPERTRSASAPKFVPETSSCCCSAGYETIGSSTPRRQSAQRQYQGKDSLIASLEEKYVLSQRESETADNSSSTDSLEHLPQEPLHMLGGMVSPHLVQAKASLHPALPHCCTVRVIKTPGIGQSHSQVVLLLLPQGSRLLTVGCCGRRQL